MRRGSARAPRDLLYRVALALAVGYTLFMAVYLIRGESAEATALESAEATAIEFLRAQGRHRPPKVADHSRVAVAREARARQRPNPPPPPPPPPGGGARARLDVAFAITMTRDGPYVDGAAVLAQSVRAAHAAPGGARAAAGDDGFAAAPYAAHLVALVHPSVSNATRRRLALCGFRVLARATPVATAEIRGDALRAKIDASGCCGAAELIKLWAYTLTEYDRVVHLDMDSLVLKPLGAVARARAAAAPGALVYTFDYNMAGPGARAPPIQGGFLAITPSRATFDALLAVVREGDYRFADGSGWGGARVGAGWGGQTVQGLLPYYYLVRARAPERERALSPSLAPGETTR